MILEKLKILGNAASWDSCGGVKQKSLRKAGIPADFADFVHDCSGTSESCRLMKVLQSNKCVHDCKYCANTLPGKKAELIPEEIATSFMALARKGFVQGLFLSSAVTKDADSTAGKLVETARLLRQRHNFQGYIHLKVLPETPRERIFKMSRYANRLSLNLEVTCKQHLNELASTKSYHNDLEKRLSWVSKAKEKGLLGSLTTQLILGAACETDKDIVAKMDSLYRETALHRTYFSAFAPVKGTSLEKRNAEHVSRERVLYNVDWLLRVYGFGKKEIGLGLNEGSNFSLSLDPKMAIALNNPGQFPVDVNHAEEKELLKVPGIGPKTAKALVLKREQGPFKSLKDLKEAGVITRRAQSFVMVNGSRQARIFE